MGVSRVMAKRLKATITTAVLTWARQTAGFSLAEAARRLKVKEERLTEWEDPNSGATPSLPQLRKLAGLFKRPLAVFYLQEAPPQFAVMRDLRRLPGDGRPKLLTRRPTRNPHRQRAPGIGVGACGGP